MATATLPIPITEAVLIDSSVSEPSVGEEVYNAGTIYAAGAKVILGAPASTATISIAAPGVVTLSAHGFPDGTPIVLTTTGALPSGLTAGEIYYIVNRATGTFQLSETIDGLPITTTGSQTGTHTATASIHRTYQSQVGSNTGNPPAIDDGSKWIDIGPTNLWSMVDLYRESVTWADSPYTFKLTSPGVVRSIFLGGLVATSVDIVVKVGAVTKYTTSIDLSTRRALTFTEFWTKPFTYRKNVQRLDIPLYVGATIEITVANIAGKVGVGEVVIGNPQYLGKTQYGAERKVRNWTKFDRNFDGTPQAPVRRRNVPTSAQTIWFDKANTVNLMRFFDETNASVVVVSGLDDDTDDYFEPTLILGLITTADINLAHPNHGVLTLVAEEY